MSRIIAGLGTAIAVMAALAAVGCGGSKPAKFYLLQSERSEPEAAQSRDAGDLEVIGVLPVVLPDYLMRPQIASRADGNRLDYAEYDRWAEPLQDTILRLISDDLEQEIPGHLVVKHPWMANLDLDYRLRVELEQFDLYEGGSAVLKGTWAIGEGRSGPWRRYGSIGLTDTFDEEKKPDYPARVAALNRLVHRMSEQLAGEIRSYLQSPQPK